MRVKNLLCLTILVALFCYIPCLAQELNVIPTDDDGVHEIGETIAWRIEWTGEPRSTQARYVLKKNGLTEVGSGTVEITDGKGTLETSLDEPGTILAEVKVRPAEGKEQRALGGAAVAPEKIQPSSPRPQDFDAFWDAKIEQLRSIPASPQLTNGESDKPNVDYWQITMDNINGSKIRGQLARPTEGEKFPAVLIVQWAGVYGLEKSWVTDRARDGWLALNILAHDLPIDQPREFYQEQSRGALRDYPGIGNEDRETSYFLRMYLSCYRAAEYLAQREDWDGRTLVVMGGSQGGMQALVTAALHPRITAAMASVPAGCDMLGPASGRAPGWPMWYWKTQDRDAEKVHETSRYFDVVNFAPRIKCPVLIGAGLIDEVCPPAGIYAAANRITGPVEVVPLPRGPHGNENNSHAPYDKRLWGEWLPTLLRGEPAPMK